MHHARKLHLITILREPYKNIHQQVISLASQIQLLISRISKEMQPQSKHWQNMGTIRWTLPWKSVDDNGTIWIEVISAKLNCLPVYIILYYMIIDIILLRWPYIESQSILFVSYPWGFFLHMYPPYIRHCYSWWQSTSFMCYSCTQAMHITLWMIWSTDYMIRTFSNEYKVSCCSHTVQMSPHGPSY